MYKDYFHTHCFLVSCRRWAAVGRGFFFVLLRFCRVFHAPQLRVYRYSNNSVPPNWIDHGKWWKIIVQIIESHLFSLRSDKFLSDGVFLLIVFFPLCPAQQQIWSHSSRDLLSKNWARFLSISLWGLKKNVLNFSSLNFSSTSCIWADELKSFSLRFLCLYLYYLKHRFD